MMPTNSAYTRTQIQQENDRTRNTNAHDQLHVTTLETITSDQDSNMFRNDFYNLFESCLMVCMC